VSRGLDAGLLIADDALSCMSGPDSAFAGGGFDFVSEADGLTRLAGGDDGVLFDLSRSVLELTETGTVTRGAEAVAWAAAASNEANILRVCSSHFSSEP